MYRILHGLTMNHKISAMISAIEHICSTMISEFYWWSYAQNTEWRGKHFFMHEKTPTPTESILHTEHFIVNAMCRLLYGMSMNCLSNDISYRMHELCKNFRLLLSVIFELIKFVYKTGSRITFLYYFFLVFLNPTICAIFQIPALR